MTSDEITFVRTLIHTAQNAVWNGYAEADRVATEVTAHIATELQRLRELEQRVVEALLDTDLTHASPSEELMNNLMRSILVGYDEHGDGTGEEYLALVDAAVYRVRPDLEPGRKA